MVTKEEAKERLKQLIKDFSQIPKSHLDSMPEEIKIVEESLK